MSVPNNFTFGEGTNAPTNDRTETQSVSIPPETTLADMFVIVREIRKEQIDKNKEQEILNKQFTAFLAVSRDQNARPSRRSNSTSSHSPDDSPSRRRRHRSHERRVSINPLRDNIPSTSAIHPNAPQVLINPFGNNNSAPAPASDKQKLEPKNYLQSIPYFDGTAMGYDVNEFLIRCKHAKKYSSSHDEHELLTLLIGRLKGEALRRAGKAQLRQIDDFIEFIRENFGTPRTYHTMRDEINKLRQGDSSKNVNHTNNTVRKVIHKSTTLHGLKRIAKPISNS
ncbi:hypothetical protein PV328_004099 [Microctonus aethiopoides]|uniref:Uncharacterized protein n=1 Tax=Microctonus aethiopoides TaxID=144406 RepID=A0AA39KL80_9HYME|nr:hypothetical protein PV328_004099 [Microctonus aethiopoides]